MGQVIVVVGKLHDTGLWIHCVDVRSLGARVEA